MELQNLHPELLQNVSIRTVQHRLQEDLGLPCQKPLLTDWMKKQRLAFAKKYAHWITEQCKKGMFFDESNFPVFKMRAASQPRSDTLDHLIAFIVSSDCHGVFLEKKGGEACTSFQKTKNAWVSV